MGPLFVVVAGGGQQTLGRLDQGRTPREHGGARACRVFLDGKDEQTVDRMAKQPPLERLGTPEDIARVVAFLAGPQGRWVNGQLLRATGGIV